MNAADDRLRHLVGSPDGRSFPCKACNTTSPPFGVVSFHRGVGRPDPGPKEPLVQHQRCPNCGLLFTSAFDHWSPADFQAHIYNADYLEYDPDYVSKRALGYAAFFIERLEAARGEIRILDYGGGNGALAAELRKSGFNCETYDPFSEAFRERPKGRFNLISCIETLEHVPQPRQTLTDLIEFADDRALVIYTTVVQPPTIEAERLAWWYVGPRNGHITFYTPVALARLWTMSGFQTGSFNQVLHAAMRNPPPFASLLIGAPASA
jgi:2-polyprenyl-6-hydroxyphenyl methylase/3-demethylubiquinone-9 3-methyltransferase